MANAINHKHDIIVRENWDCSSWPPPKLKNGKGKYHRVIANAKRTKHAACYIIRVLQGVLGQASYGGMYVYMSRSQHNSLLCTWVTVTVPILAAKLVEVVLELG